ncbi:MAG: Lactyl (2) diphospho-(5')guanosine:7,8-didemethyl-8-hydroxy-5-deazariboflavin 2-phospho-L-lactate transferase, partial [uncultured Nocardioides sp.]
AEDHGPLRRRRRGQVHPGSPPRDRGPFAARGRCRRRGHGGRQHRRRPVDPRPQGLPRPRHRHVHPRERDRHRTRVGPPRGDVERQDRAGAVRRGADLVRAGGPRHRHPPGADPDARVRLSPLRGHRGVVPTLEPGGAAAAHDRRPGGDPRRRRRCRGPQRQARHPLPGVLGAPARTGPCRGPGLRGPRAVDPGAGGPRGRRRRRPGHRAAVQPGRVGGHDPRGAGAARCVDRDGSPGRRPVPHRRRHPRARDGEGDAHGDRRGRDGGGRRPPLRRPDRRWRARRLVGRRLRPAPRGRRRVRGHRVPGGPAHDDRPRSDGGDGSGGDRAGPPRV